jgi:hypothetical protein
VVKRLAILVLLVGCGSFDDPQIVLDLRVLGSTAQPPEQVVPFDPQDPPSDPAALGLVDAQICSLVADPGADRRLDWKMTVCAPTDELRCNHLERPSFELGHGTIDDPDTTATAQPICATLPADAGLLVVIEDAVSLDSLAGFGGVDVLVELQVTPADDPSATLFAGKRVRYAPLLPADRVANTNPTLTRIDILVQDRDPRPLPLGRCAVMATPLAIAPGAMLPLLPVEPDGVREDYVVPTFDGGERMFTESPTYQWLATAGSWNRGDTGGPRDASGMFPPLDSTWTAPDVTAPTDVSLWLIQRDERLGAAWFESCVRVTP